MKKSHLCILALTCLISKGFSQDQLFKKDNSKVLVKIIEINPEEIKYKLFSNPNGPIYTESKNNVSLIIYESGQHEVINSGTVQSPDAPATVYAGTTGSLSKADSLSYYRYTNNISINFFNFFNNELGLTYQKEFFKSHFNIVIPVAFGVERPNVTQSVYFNNNYNYDGVSSYALDKKLFDVGFGINYYPSLRSNINYYIGPVFKYMQYNGTQNYSYRVLNSGIYPNYTNVSVSRNNTLSRYSMSITNGVIFRTRSRITASLYGSLGFKNDVINNPIVDPVTNKSVDPVRNNISLFFWCGFNVGFNF
jgi:hypothetical protein